jgi:hypothetical protein
MTGGKQLFFCNTTQKHVSGVERGVVHSLFGGAVAFSHEFWAPVYFGFFDQVSIKPFM